MDQGALQQSNRNGESETLAASKSYAACWNLDFSRTQTKET
jgi:hypothetical protein